MERIVLAPETGQPALTARQSFSGDYVGCQGKGVRNILFEAGQAQNK